MPTQPPLRGGWVGYGLSSPLAGGRGWGRVYPRPLREGVGGGVGHFSSPKERVGNCHCEEERQ